MAYSAPKITDLGSVRELTLGAPPSNKVGLKSDVLSAPSAALGINVVGSVVPVQP